MTDRKDFLEYVDQLNIDDEEKEYIKSTFDKVAKVSEADESEPGFKKGFETATHEIFETIGTVSEENFKIVNNFINDSDDLDKGPKDLIGSLELGFTAVEAEIYEAIREALMHLELDLEHPEEGLKLLKIDFKNIENKIFELVMHIFKNNFGTVKALYEAKYPDALATDAKKD